MNRTFRTFVVTVITEVEYVSGTSDEQDENTLRHLTEELAKAANNLSLRSVQGVRVTFSAGGVMPPA